MWSQTWWLSSHLWKVGLCKWLFWVHICWEIASAEAQHSSVALLSLYTFFVFAQHVRYCFVPPVSLYSEFSDTVVCVSPFLFSPSLSFFFFTVFSCVTKSQLSDLPPGVYRVHWLSGITWVGLSCTQLVCAFLQPLNHYRKDQKMVDQLKQKHPISFEIFAFCFYWKSGSIWDSLWVQLRTPVCLLVTSGLCWH